MSDVSASRRDFLKGATYASVTAGAAQFALNTAVHAGVDDTIKIGLVGCGGRGTGAAQQALSTNGRVKLVAMGDAFADRIDGALNGIRGQLKDKAAERVAVADDHKFVGFDAYQKVLASGVDLIILATPPGFRSIHFKAAVEAGKHVFMEKPVAVDVPGVRMVLEANEIAKQKKLKVGVGLQRHHQVEYLETIKRIHDGEIGDVLALRVYWNGGGVWEPPLSREKAKSEMEYQMRNWYYYNWLCGDHIVEQHIHNLDVGNWIKSPDPKKLNHPIKAHGMGGRQVRVDKRYGEIYDHHAVEFEYADGSRMYSQCRHIPSCWNSVSEHAHGTKGWSDVSGDRITVYGGDTWRYRGPKPNPYQVEHDDLFAAIRAGADYNEAENGAISSMISILGRLATYSGQVISWDDAMKSEISLMPKEFSWDAKPLVLPREDGSYPVATPGVTKVV